MKKTKIIAAAFLLVILAVVVTYTVKANGSNSKVETAVHINNASDVYTCPMHPEVLQNEPGKCPKCGMDLVLKDVKNDNALMDCCKDTVKCKEMGCNIDKCKQNSAACSEKCMMMNDMKKHDMKSHDMKMMNECMEKTSGCSNNTGKSGSCCDK